MAATEKERRQENESVIDYHAKLRKYMYCEDGDYDSIETDSIENSKHRRQHADVEDEIRTHTAEDERSMLSIDGGEQDNFTPSSASSSSEKLFSVAAKTSAPQETITDELVLAHEQNRKLKEKLSQVEHCYERLSKTKEDMQLELDAQFTARGAALIDKIYTAQKEREESIKTRLKLVTEEKEELSKKVKKLEKDNGVDSGVETNSMGDELWLNADNMSLDEIVGRVIHGRHSTSIEFNGEVVVDRASSKGQKKRSYSSSGEVKKVKEERDAALKQVEQLTDELHEAQRERSMFETQHRKNEKNRLKILQNQMKGVIKDRDQAIEKAQTLRDQLERAGRPERQRRVKSSSLNESSIQKQLNATLEEYKCKVKENEEEIFATQSAYDDLHNKLNRMVNEKNDMAVQVQQAVNKSNEDKKRADKLERLLVALRRRKER